MDPDRFPSVLYLLLGLVLVALSISNLIKGDYVASGLLALIAAMQFRAAFRRRRGQSVALWGNAK